VAKAFWGRLLWVPVVVALSLIPALAVGSGTAGAAGPPAITVTPDTGLGLNPTVQVGGSGWSNPPGQQVFFAECVGATINPGNCVQVSGSASTDASGSFSPVPVLVHRVVQSQDCVLQSCQLVALWPLSLAPTESATHPLSFDPTIPLPGPGGTLMALPNSLLTDRQTVQVSGSNLPASFAYQLQECTQAGCDPTTSVPANSDSAGNLGPIGFTVHTTFVIPNATGPVDCGTQQCYIAATGSTQSPPPRVGISFSSPFTPTLRLLFAAGDGVPGSSFAMTKVVCAATPTDTSSFDFTASRTLAGGWITGTFTESGSVTFPGSLGPATVTTTFTIKDAQGVVVASGDVGPSPSGQRFSPEGGCDNTVPGDMHYIGALGFHVTFQPSGVTDHGSSNLAMASDNPSGDAPAGNGMVQGFSSSSAPPPLGGLSASPNSGLVDGDHVTVSGASLVPSSPYQLQECVVAGCDLSNSVAAPSDANGNLGPIDFTVHTTFTATGPGGTTAVDCNNSNTQCAIAAVGVPSSGQFPPFVQIGFRGPPAPMQMEIAACPNVTQTMDPAPSAGPGNHNCGPSVFSPGGVLVQPDNTCTMPTNSALGTVPASQNPIGLWVQVEEQRSCNPPPPPFPGARAGSFTINVTQTAPTPGPTRSIPGTTGYFAGNFSVLVPIGNLAPGTYNVTVDFPAQTLCSPQGTCFFVSNNDAGATSATGTLVVGPPPKAITMGPQAMEGDLKVGPGSTLQVGYDFTMPGSHPAATVTFVGARVVFQATCVSGTGSATLTVPINDQGYQDAASSSAWLPSGDQSNAVTYQGSLTVPDVCNGGLVRLQQGGTFTAGVTSTDKTDKVNIRWHYRDGTDSGGWSGTLGVIPN
jgi:Neocarzinostatin family